MARLPLTAAERFGWDNGGRMRRFALVLAAGAVAAGIGAGSASAVEPPLAEQPYRQVANQEMLRDLVERAVTGSPDPTIPGDLDPEKARRGLWRARTAARVLPALRLLGPVALAASAPEAVVGYKVTIGATLNWFRFGTFGAGRPGTYADPNVTLEVGPWSWQAAGGDGVGGTGSYGYPASYVRSFTGSFSASEIGLCMTPGHSYCVGGASVTQANFDSSKVQLQAAGIGAEHWWWTSDNQGIITRRYMWIATEDAMEQTLRPQLYASAPTGSPDPSWYTELPAGQKASSSYTRPADAGDTAEDYDAIKAELDSEPDPDARTWINRYLDPTYDSDVAPTITMPNCIGVSQTACGAALDSAVHTGTRTYTVLERDAADLTKPAGVVVTQSRQATTTFESDQLVTFTVNPTPLPIVWVAANSAETYDDYLIRLRALGWLGTVSLITLGDNNGDSEYIASGVPCTSVQTGARIAPSDPASIYQNSVTLGAGDPNQTSAACTGRLLTSKTSKRCSFHIVRWLDQIQGNETFYDQACNDAWTYFWANQDIFDDVGKITQWALDNAQLRPIVAGVKLLADAELWAKLSAQDSDPSHWEKGTTTTFNFTHPFQIHFYRHLPSNTIRYDVDFKIRFSNVFWP
ncbi:MAG: hypothetical protein MSC30_04920 [Gaiellaceae bacterium MAG52_C11]|nr:hypothetical protein [Candidatus Gaiellasilicea maunaloa]